MTVLSAAQNHRRLGGILWSDSEGYYMYLPAVFLYRGFEDIPVRSVYQFFRDPMTGRYFTKYPYGVALLELPFFLVGDLAASILGFPRDGYASPYAWSVAAGGLTYGFLGIVVLLRLLRTQVSALAAWSAVLCLFFGTNLFYYTIMEPGMSHVYSFFLFSLFLFMTARVHERPALTSWLIIGLTFGLIVAVRPVNAIVGLYLLLYVPKDAATTGVLSYQRRFLLRNLEGALVAAVVATAMLVPQLLYWKYAVGRFVHYPYGEEGFSHWRNPKIFQVLFGAWNGWLLYSPMAILPLARLALDARRNRNSERAILSIMVAATLTFASWWAWWFGGAFGHRCYVEYYALLAIPFAHLWERAFRWSTPVRGALVVLCAVFVYYSMSLSYQYASPWDGLGWTYRSLWNEIEKMCGLAR